MSDSKAGDKVRIQIDVEGTIDEDGEVQVFEGVGAYLTLSELKRSIQGLTVTKIEPPLVYFNPGDTVRRIKPISDLDSHYHTRVLGDEGYIVLPGGSFYRYGKRGGYGQRGGYLRADFNSRTHELVTPS